ncbi:hypothetical protein CT0861_11597 [Colletotrichum tofieldiae]|uniref:Uncharacterized protein n=1 Tax=Colletotrichum tofieldiae TaxID=708197 RepID=A0A166QQZ7_9PEZI|nr:hypothetical protein CT0861_11597 [Colletotrichum tofieldiae]GKT57253.1 hypothetical protein ColTof3_04592 [Colletotrichum tofieldiae]GKT86806.1 hypothetical protein Ct61P_04656 [Colletotrichum tofieldiae]
MQGGMLRLDATVIHLTISEVKAYGRHHHNSKDHRRRTDSDPLSMTTSSRTRWQSPTEAIHSPLTYPSERLPLILPKHAFSTAEGFEVYTGGDDDDKTETTHSINVNETMALTTEQYTAPSGSTAISRLPLPPPFDQPGTLIRPSRAIGRSEASHFALPTLRTPSARSLAVTSPDDHGTHRTATVRASLRQLLIYDDAATAIAQPQTPRNVPEARHQSQLHGSYTAPSTRTLTLETLTPSSRLRRRRAGATSPAGMVTPGFVGLYGGMENSDEVVLYEAEMRHLLTSRRDVRGRQEEHNSE